MVEININGKKVGLKYEPYFIADIAANHDGNIERALKLIELAKEAGADAAKFQNFTASKIVSKKTFDSDVGRVSHQAKWKKSVFQVYDEATVPKEWTQILKNKCDEVGIEYLTSPYDFENVDHADKYSNAFKIGSGDLSWHDMIKHIASKGKPVLLATGASTMDEVIKATQIVNSQGAPLVLMQCNTNYTANIDNYHFINLNVLNTYKENFPNAVLGISDHTFGCETVLGAIALGARVIEKHFTDDNNREGPDHHFAMNPTTWRNMVDSSLKVFNALGDGIKKIEDNEKQTAVVQRRSLHYVRDIRAGEVLKKEDIFPLRPICKDGIQPYDENIIIGKKLIKDVSSNDYARMVDFFND